MKHPSLSLAPRGALAALALGLALSGCAGMPTNRSMYSVHEPVVEKANYTFDLSSNEAGLSYPEQQRLAGWFKEIGLRYGDKLAINDPLQSPGTRAAVEAIASKYGMMVDDDVPATGPVLAGTARVVVTRSKAAVHGCPDWSAHSDANFANGLSPNFGCGVNSNLAAMVADPDHLIKGDDATGNTTIMSSNKAISTYREQVPTGANGVKAVGSKGN